MNTAPDPDSSVLLRFYVEVGVGVFQTPSK